MIRAADLATREGVEEYVVQVVQRGARLNFEHDGYLRTVAFVLVTRDIKTGQDLPDGVGIVVVGCDPFRGEEDKDNFANGIRQIAKDGRAVGVVFLSEVWSVFYNAPKEGDGDKILKEMEAWYASGRSLESHPNRQECLYMVLEHKTGHRVWQCWIHRDTPDGLGRLDTWQELQTGGGSSQGRFSGLSYQWQ